ncbi:radical SAM/SPASM domain-containing protein [Deltaproteobacteria bacterium TL4]
MEYVNITSIQNSNSAKISPPLIPDTPEGHVLTTDQLELISGTELVQKAVQKNEFLLPLKRYSPIKKTERFPKRVLLELTSKCNSFCTMCPRNTLTREEQHMDTSLAKKIIQQLAEVGISGLWLYNIGESLLHPDFFEILKFCRKFDNLGTIWLSTNGAILNSQLIDKLFKIPVDILNYSVNAMSEEQYKKINPSLSFQRVQANLKQLLQRKKELGVSKPLLRLQMIEMPFVLHEIEEFKKVFGPQADMISINKLEVFNQDVLSLEKNTTNTQITKCNRLEREDFFIFSDGSVSCCDTDFNCTMNVGNLGVSTLKEIFEGEKYQGILQQYRDGLLHLHPLCSTCKDYNL